MPITIDIQKDGLYLKGYWEGYEKGFKKVDYRFAENCLKHGVSIDLTAEIMNLSIEEVTEIQKRLKEAGEL